MIPSVDCLAYVSPYFHVILGGSGAYKGTLVVRTHLRVVR